MPSGRKGYCFESPQPISLESRMAAPAPGVRVVAHTAPLKGARDAPHSDSTERTHKPGATPGPARTGDQKPELGARGPSASVTARAHSVGTAQRSRVQEESHALRHQRKGNRYETPRLRSYQGGHVPSVEPPRRRPILWNNLGNRRRGAFDLSSLLPSKAAGQGTRDDAISPHVQSPHVVLSETLSVSF